MRLIYFIPLLALILFSCFFSECDKVNFSQEDRDWMSGYVLGDTLVFKNVNKEQRDTFVIQYCSTSYSDCNKIEKGDKQYEEGLVSAVSINQSEVDNHYNCGFSFWQTKELQHDSINPSSKTFNVFDFNSKDIYDAKSELNSFDKQVDFYNKNVFGYNFESKIRKGENLCSQKIQSFFWSKKYGLISYKYQSGEEYVLFGRW